MTSSCFHYGSCMTILLCLIIQGAPKGPVGLPDTHPSDLSGWSLGAWPASLGGWTSWASLGCSFFAPKTPFFESKRQLSSFFFDFLTSHDCMCFFLSLNHPDLRKRGARWILVAGVSLHVIESTSFSSPTAPPDPQRPPGDPPRPPQEVWK